MASSIRILRRLNGAAGSPPAAQAVEGALAVNMPGAAGTTGKPSLFVGDGTGWRLVNPDVNVSTQSLTLPAGADIGAGYTAWAATPGNTITGNVVIATFGTPPQAYVLTNPAAPGTAASWTSLGGAVAFATDAEVLAGTDTTKAIHAAGLQSRTIDTPSATATADAGYLPRLNAQGKIDSGFLNVTPTTFIGAVDVTAAYTAPATPPGVGSFMTVATTGAPDASWAAVIDGTHATLDAGDLLIWDGAKFHVVEHDIDLAAYLPLAGGQMAANAAVQWPGAATAEAGNVLLNLKGGTLDGAVIDAGTY